MKVKVIKRNGSIEPFLPAKIAKVVKAAGLKTDEAKKLATRVEKWVKGRGEPKITSLQIRTKVFREMRKVNPHAANLYTWYQKLKDDEVSKNNMNNGK